MENFLSCLQHKGGLLKSRGELSPRPHAHIGRGGHAELARRNTSKVGYFKAGELGRGKQSEGHLPRGEKIYQTPGIAVANFSLHQANFAHTVFGKFEETARCCGK